MQPLILLKKLEAALKSIEGLEIELQSSQIYRGESFEDLETSWRGGDNEGAIHKAGVYLIGDKNEVYYIGKGGPDKKNDQGGKMGDRVFQHLNKMFRRKEPRIICLLPMLPREYSQLGEQLAFAIHFENDKKLPKYNKDRDYN